MEDVTATQTGLEEVKPLQLSEIQLLAYQVAQKELDNYNKLLEEKKYLVDITQSDVDTLVSFIGKDAKWKFMEALGIVEVIKVLNQSVDKRGKVFISAVAIEAIYYYLSKVEGSGNKVESEAIGTVETYLRLLKAVNSTRNAVGKDNEEKKRLEYVLACRAEGLDPETPVQQDEK